MFSELTILRGNDKKGLPEPVPEITIKTGQVYSIVGFTGSGKSQLINDIEQMAQRDTVTKRRILLDSRAPGPRERQNPESKLVAHLSQNMSFVMDMQVKEFLVLHAACRGVEQSEKKAEEVMSCANTLAGEPIKHEDVLTSLSGGQSRALMIADVAVVSESPIILIDEVENAGIDRRAAMETLAERGKIVLIVTHDPLLALLGERRIHMRNGGIQKVLELSAEERRIRQLLEKNSDMLSLIQNSIREGESLSFPGLEREMIGQREVNRCECKAC